MRRADVATHDDWADDLADIILPKMQRCGRWVAKKLRLVEDIDMTNKAQIKCFQCHHVWIIPDRKDGKFVGCPICTALNTVPEPPEPPAMPVQPKVVDAPPLPEPPVAVVVEHIAESVERTEKPEARYVKFYHTPTQDITTLYNEVAEFITSIGQEDLITIQEHGDLTDNETSEEEDPQYNGMITVWFWTK